MLNLNQRLAQARLIFTVTQGRTGTKLLAEVLKLVPGICAEHEPFPVVDNVWWRLRHDHTIARRWLLNHKLPAVIGELDQTGSEIYFETSHMLCKGFFEPLHDLGIDFDIVLLSRPLTDIATSLYHLGNIPRRTKTGRRWLLDPEDVSNISELPKPYSQYSDYQLVFWYVLEMELRKEHYWNLWTSTFRTAARINVEHILNIHDLSGFLAHMDLPELPRERLNDYLEVIGTAHNQKSAVKSHMAHRGMVEPLRDIKNQEFIVMDKIKYEEILGRFR